MSGREVDGQGAGRLGGSSGEPPQARAWCRRVKQLARRRKQPGEMYTHMLMVVSTRSGDNRGACDAWQRCNLCRCSDGSLLASLPPAACASGSGSGSNKTELVAGAIPDHREIFLSAFIPHIISDTHHTVLLTRLLLTNRIAFKKHGPFASPSYRFSSAGPSNSCC